VAKATDEILAACLEELQAGTATIDGCLHRYPEIAAELGPLLHLALALQPTEDLVLSPEFRVAARQRLLDAMTSTARSRAKRETVSCRYIHGVSPLCLLSVWTMCWPGEPLWPSA